MANKQVTRQEVMDVLKQCLDPELGIDIVNLGLIYDVDIKPERILLTMTLTTPGCPLVPYFREDIVKRIKDISGVPAVDIDLSFDPPWDPSKMSAEAKQQLTMMR